MCLGVRDPWSVVCRWEREKMVMTSDNRDRFGNSRRCADPLYRPLHLCSATPVDGAQAVESFVGANGIGVACLLGVERWLFI